MVGGGVVAAAYTQTLSGECCVGKQVEGEGGINNLTWAPPPQKKRGGFGLEMRVAV